MSTCNMLIRAADVCADLALVERTVAPIVLSVADINSSGKGAVFAQQRTQSLDRLIDGTKLC